MKFVLTRSSQKHSFRPFVVHFWLQIFPDCDFFPTRFSTKNPYIEHGTLNIDHWTLNIGHWTLNIEHWTLNIEQLNIEQLNIEQLNIEQWTRLFVYIIQTKTFKTLLFWLRQCLCCRFLMLCLVSKLTIKACITPSILTGFNQNKSKNPICPNRKTFLKKQSKLKASPLLEKTISYSTSEVR